MIRHGRDFAAAQAWDSRKRLLRATRVELTLLVLTSIVAAALMALQPQWFAPYLVGAAIVGLAWFIHWGLWTNDGAFWQRKGSEAQRLTRKEFEKARVDGWTAVGPVVFERGDQRFDVDLVGVGPRGVLAVETKYTTNAKLTEANASQCLRKALWQAKQGANDIANVLARHEISTEVKPVVVMWGPGAPTFQNGWTRLKGVTVVSGRQADIWRPMLAGDSLDEDGRLVITQQLREIAKQGPVGL